MCLGVPGRIESVSEGPILERRGRISFGGVIREVQLGFVPNAQVGDYVIVHVGVAISRLDQAEAERTLRFLSQLGEKP